MGKVETASFPGTGSPGIVHSNEASGTFGMLDAAVLISNGVHRCTLPSFDALHGEEGLHASVAPSHGLHAQRAEHSSIDRPQERRCAGRVVKAHVLSGKNVPAMKFREALWKGARAGIRQCRPRESAVHDSPQHLQQPPFLVEFIPSFPFPRRSHGDRQISGRICDILRPRTALRREARLLLLKSLM